MTFDDFKASLVDWQPPCGLAPIALALWHDGRGDWGRAHDVAQDVHDRSGAHVHAYLHRKEGDLGNALYRYRRAGVHPAGGDLDEEWQDLVALVLGDR